MMQIQTYYAVTVPCKFGRLQGKEFTEQIDGFAATAALQAKNSQANTGLSVCTV
jgi:hypothetical protein